MKIKRVSVLMKIFSSLNSRQFSSYVSYKNVCGDFRPWFENQIQEVPSSCSNTIDENWEKWKRPPIYKYKSNGISYPIIRDNTEGEMMICVYILMLCDTQAQTYHIYV